MFYQLDMVHHVHDVHHRQRDNCFSNRTMFHIFHPSNVIIVRCHYTSAARIRDGGGVWGINVKPVVDQLCVFWIFCVNMS